MLAFRFAIAAILSSTLALEGCSAAIPRANGGYGTSTAVGVSLEPRAVCPAIGQTFSKGNASTVLRKENAIVQLGKRPLVWTVVFSKQPKPVAPASFAPRLLTCGPAGAKNPIGSVKDSGGGTTEAKKVNDSWTVTVNYFIEYVPPAKLPGAAPWRYNLVRFVPMPPKAPFGPLPGFVVEVKNL